MTPFPLSTTLPCTLLLIDFDPIARFPSNFFQTVCNYKAHLPEMFLGIKIVAAVNYKQKNSNWGKVGSEKEFGEEPVCIIVKNCFETVYTQ